MLAFSHLSFTAALHLSVSAADVGFGVAAALVVVFLVVAGVVVGTGVGAGVVVGAGVGAGVVIAAGVREGVVVGTGVGEGVVVGTGVVVAVEHGTGVMTNLNILQGPPSVSVHPESLDTATKHFDCFCDQFTHPHPSVQAAWQA